MVVDGLDWGGTEPVDDLKRESKPVPITWSDYYHAITEAVAAKSKDPTKVGAILVAPGGEIILTAFNGPPRGVGDTPERFERPAKYLFASHAEANLIAFAARNGIKTQGCKVYVTHAPCASCARTLIQAGIAEIHHGDGTTSMPAEEFEAAREMLCEADILLLPKTTPTTEREQR